MSNESKPVPTVAQLIDALDSGCASQQEQADARDALSNFVRNAMAEASTQAWGANILQEQLDATAAERDALREQLSDEERVSSRWLNERDRLRAENAELRNLLEQVYALRERQPASLVADIRSALRASASGEGV